MNRLKIILIAIFFAVLVALLIGVIGIRTNHHRPIFGQSSEEIESAVLDVITSLLSNYREEVMSALSNSAAPEINFSDLHNNLIDTPGYMDLFSVYFPYSNPLAKNADLSGEYVILSDSEHFEVGFKVKKIK